MTDAQRVVALEEENAQLKDALSKRDDLIRSTFGRYLTNEVLEEILKHPNHFILDGERRIVSILFTDLRDSTKLSEQMEPAAFLTMLNHYYEEMIEIVNAWQGNILDFVGDAIVAVFGAPRVNEDSARDAVACAVAMQRRMTAVNEWNLSKGYPEIAMGIGIHRGEALLGNIGSQTRTKYDMIGRNVNLASRIEGFTVGGQILISREALEAAGPLVHVRRGGEIFVHPKGISSEIPVYDIVGFGKNHIPGVL